MEYASPNFFPTLEIEIQPQNLIFYKESHGFRYESELNAAHGSLKGNRPQTACYPTIKIRHYYGPVTVYVLLLNTTVTNRGYYMPHYHKLLTKETNLFTFNRQGVVIPISTKQPVDVIIVNFNTRNRQSYRYFISFTLKCLNVLKSKVFLIHFKGTNSINEIIPNAVRLLFLAVPQLETVSSPILQVVSKPVLDSSNTVT
ncbi:hypothetical protein TrispH2_003410 [Trichoplax sp. H2]|nr:hypothetical protein TrispH2_003410 [Trichoplax sp. H2]|eukprot:RDD44632.1 hypothetical protein TrispH2_003410 [Trichoplax sp. H2]